jgi:hypothetical protein
MARPPPQELWAAGLRFVGSGSEREHPADASEAAVTGLAKPGGLFGPAEDFRNPLAHPATDRIAGMAGRPSVNG